MPFKIVLLRPQKLVTTKTLLLKHYYRHQGFLRKCSKIFPEVFEPLLVVEKKSRKISRQISPQKIKKKSLTSFCKSAGRMFLQANEGHEKATEEPCHHSPEGPARHLDVSRQKLTPHCLAAIVDSRLS